MHLLSAGMMEARLDLSLHTSFRIDLFIPSSRTTSPNKKKRPSQISSSLLLPLNLLGFVGSIAARCYPPTFPPANQGCERKRSGGVLVGMETAVGRVVRKVGGWWDSGIVCLGREGEQTQDGDEVCTVLGWCLRCGDIRSRRRSRTLRRS